MFLYDSLSLTFIFLIMLGVVPNLFYSFGYLPHIKDKGHYLIHYFAYIISLFGVVLAANGAMFLFFWELMSLTSWQLILTDAKQKSTTFAAKFYFFMTHLGFIFIFLFFLVSSNGDLWMEFKDMKSVASNFVYPSLLFMFISIGFLSKAGAVPLHVWLPYAHPEAPSPVSALMSGVMLKIAIYGMFRFLLEVLYPWPLEWGIFILIIGSISSLVGVLYALSEHDIKALLANHSIENIGIILIGFGMGMIFDSLHMETLSSFAFIASFFHIFNHMSFKSLLFMGAGSVLYQTHTKNIENYGALIKSMPITAITFLLASISISALPPTNGFLSEWMIFQSMLSSNIIEYTSLKMVIPFAVFALALTGGLAIACFVKAYGITFLGLHRDKNSKHIKEVNTLMKIGMILMSIVVISLMLFTPFYIKIFDLAMVSLGRSGIYPLIFPNGIFEMHSVSSIGASVSPIYLLVLLIGVTLSLYFAYKKLGVKERIHKTWACGYQTSSKNQYSATGFAGPIGRFFDWLYKSKKHIDKKVIGDHKTKFQTAHYEIHTKPLFEKSLYDNSVKIANIISYWVYRMSYFEQRKYSSIILNLMLFVLFSYRISVNEFSWTTLLLELAVLFISLKILVFGMRK
ncbi:MAG: hydrogenase [Epsilonproteobacteria bacterium]|nr:hydrogenase [Campylobacterota bacterium]